MLRSSGVLLTEPLLLPLHLCFLRLSLSLNGELTILARLAGLWALESSVFLPTPPKHWGHR